MRLKDGRGLNGSSGKQKEDLETHSPNSKSNTNRAGPRVLTPVSRCPRHRIRIRSMHHRCIIGRIPGGCDVSRDLHPSHTFYRMFWNQNERGDGVLSIYCIQLGMASGRQVPCQECRSVCQARPWYYSIQFTRQSWRRYCILRQRQI